MQLYTYAILLCSFLSLIAIIAYQFQKSNKYVRFTSGVVEITPVPIVLIQNKTIVYANPKAVEWLQWISVEHLIGKNISVLIDSASEEFVLSHWERSQLVAFFECVCVTANRKRVDAEVIMNPFLYNGKVITQWTMYDITEKKRAQAYISKLAFTDTLTGIPNRTYLYQFMNQLRSASTLFTIMMLDIDHFKQVNDTMGHQAGDILLQQFSQRIVQSVRERDVVARHAGDEFVVILPGNVKIEDVELVAGRIISVMQAPFLIDGKSCSFTTSVGVYKRIDSSELVDYSLNRADQALYEAKHAGKNRYVLSQSG